MDAVIVPRKRPAIRPWVWLGVLIALMAAVRYVWLRNRLDLAADQAIGGMVAGSAADIWPFVPEEECACSSLTQAKLQAVLDRLVQPRLKGLEEIGSTHDVTSNGTQGSGERRFKLPDGRTWTYIAIVNRTDTTPKFGALYYALQQVWWLDGLRKVKASQLTPIQRSEATIAGIQTDRQFLEQWGIRKLFVRLGHCVTWDELIAERKEMIENDRAIERGEVPDVKMVPEVKSQR